MAIRVDREQVVQSVLDRFQRELSNRDRGGWLEKRLERYAKFRGWFAPRQQPYEGASNVHPPILEALELRAEAGLANAVMSQHPILTAVSRRRDRETQAQRATEIVDSQLTTEIPNSTDRLGEFITNFLLDGNAVAYTPWVRDERTVTLTKHVAAAPPEVAFELYVMDVLAQLFPSVTDRRQSGNDTFLVTFTRQDREDVEASVVVEETSQGLDFVISYPEVVFDGPVYHVLQIEDIVFPPSAANLQPPSDLNPRGAPFVFLIMNSTLDQVTRLARDGDYNMAGLEELERVRAGQPPAVNPEESLEQEKAAIEGTGMAEDATPPAPSDPTEGQRVVQLIVAFDRWDLGNGLEDVYFVLDRVSQTLLDARRLTDKWPAAVPYRPLAEAVFEKVPDRWYGISLLELAESSYDLIKSLIDLYIDAGRYKHIPPFFYNKRGAVRPGTFRYAPGEGCPWPGPPKDDLYFPQIQAADSSWLMQIIGFFQQSVERVSALGDIQFGRVPPGRSAALRTFAATQALMQQGDVRADLALFRLMTGVSQIGQCFHRMNRHFLPPGKEYRLYGWTQPGESPYRTLEDRGEIDVDIDFEFKASFLASNQAARLQSLQSVMSLVANGLTIQLGLTNPQQLHRLLSDLIKALREDPLKYLTPPPDGDLPALLWEDALGMVFRNEPPMGTPLEGPEMHMQKAVKFLQSNELGLLNPAQVALLKQWLGQVQALMQRDRITQAAQQFQQSIGQTPSQLGQGQLPAEGAGGQPDQEMLREVQP